MKGKVYYILIHVISFASVTMSQYQKIVSAKLVTILLVSVLLTAFLTYYVFSISFSPPDLHFDDLPSTATYAVETDGTWIWATRYDGKIQWSSTNASYVFEQLSTKEGTFFIKEGTYNVDVYTYITTVGLNQEWIGAGANLTTINVTAYMKCVFFIENIGFVSIKNIRFDCNYKTSYAIYFNGTTGASCRGIFNYNDFKGTTNYAAHFGRKAEEWVRCNYNVFRYTSGGIEADIGDSEFIGNYFAAQSNITSMMYQGSIRLLRGGNRVENNYMAGGYKFGLFVNSKENTIVGNQIDYYRCDGIVVGWAEGNIINDNRISGCGREADNTYCGIKLKGGSTKNIIGGNYIQSDGSPYRLKYAICEENGSDNNNTIVGNTIVGTFGSSRVIYVVGNHTQVSGNLGYKLGEITNPVKNGYLVDSIGTGSIANNTVYTVCQSPKAIYIQGSGTFDIKLDGVLVFDDVTQATVYLSCGDTFEIEWSSEPTITVIGE